MIKKRTFLQEKKLRFWKIFLLFLVLISTGCKGKPFTIYTISSSRDDNERLFNVSADISQIVNQTTGHTKTKLAVENVEDNFTAVERMLQGEIDFLLMNCQEEYDLFNGYGEWSKIDGREKIRAVFSVHYDTVTLAVSGFSGIFSVMDIKGKKISIGPEDSLLQLNARDVLSAFQLTLDDFDFTELAPADAMAEFRKGGLDGFFYTVSHPDQAMISLSEGQYPVRFIPLSDYGIPNLIIDYPYYTKAEINVESYPDLENAANTPTLAFKNVLLTTRDVDKKAVYTVAREIFENFEIFRKMESCFFNLTKENMLRYFVTPVHEGALDYYEETGLVKYLNIR